MEEEDDELEVGGWGGAGGGGGGGGAEIETAPEELGRIGMWWWWWWWEEGGMMLVVASLSLYLSISALTALSSACKDWTCCCKAEIAPMHPYTGSLSLTFASYTRLFAASALWLSGTSYKNKEPRIHYILSIFCHGNIISIFYQVVDISWTCKKVIFSYSNSRSCLSRIRIELPNQNDGFQVVHLYIYN